MRIDVMPVSRTVESLISRSLEVLELDAPVLF